MLAEAGRRVLIVDCDPQANLSEAFGWYADALVVGEHNHERARPVFTDSFTSVYLYVYPSVYPPVFTSVRVNRCGDRHAASFWS
jgi:cellulose biosynthesis protein BcsQ